jgi:hypothetical protein
VNLLGGLKLPSGNPDFLGEELEPVGAPAGPGVPLRGVPQHSTPGGDDDHDDPPGRRLFGGIHGHDLALGSGSVDGILGASTYASYDRFFMTAVVQYAVRREGAFDYRYANDLTWFGCPARPRARTPRRGNGSTTPRSPRCTSVPACASPGPRN